ncbi:hypothetical protein [Paraliomyxa miuraensis]|uniref:hypothetical protein n=1 Tax=Paraliomyxa miuraensis TaxID=376150 RepID=UPI00225A07AC|nr:hypothetical protein [Paraliomyxa miuraensis]MCX4240007.1 hypothetical protein [Paraliomyxa miuraensis]
MWPLCWLAGCSFDSEVAERVSARIVVDSSGVAPIETDLGYRVELTRCRVAVDTLEFTTNGEMHATWLRSPWDLLVPTAFAHPGHDAGGEVVGELEGRHLFDWRDDGELLGEAILLAARYDGANFSFTRARVEDGIAADDPILGHTFEIAGIATLDDERYEFSILLDQDEGRRVVGLPVDLDLSDGANEDLELGLQLLAHDPFEDDTLLDGIDFAVLDDDGDHVVVLEPDTDAYNLLRRSTQTHDFYGVTIH